MMLTMYTITQTMCKTRTHTHTFIHTRHTHTHVNILRRNKCEKVSRNLEFKDHWPIYYIYVDCLICSVSLMIKCIWIFVIQNIHRKDDCFFLLFFKMNNQRNNERKFKNNGIGFLFFWRIKKKFNENKIETHHVSKLLNFLVTTLPNSMPSRSTIRWAKSGCDEPENTLMFGILDSSFDTLDCSKSLWTKVLARMVDL